MTFQQTSSFGRPDDDQWRVMSAPTDRAILLQAGPGSGKTRTLIGRISFLLHAQQVDASQIVAITFTNKAAHELQERIARRLDEAAPYLLVGTFHALAHRILRQHADAVSLDPRFTVCDEPLQDEMLRHALQRSAASPHADPTLLNALRAAFSACKRERHDPTECPGTHPLPDGLGSHRALLPAVADHYLALLRQHNMLDFDDLIRYAAQALYDEPTLGAAWRRAHPWLCLDEFHDIDRAQYQLVQLLALPGSATVLAVADEQQRIYRWRGADGALLAQFCRDYRPERYELRCNYRSDQHIIRACDQLLHSGGVARLSQGKQAREGWIERWWSEDEAQEADWLVAELGRLQGEGGALGEVAILYRTHRAGEALEQALAQRGIPLERIQRQPFWERPEVQELRRYLQSAVNVADECLAAALNFPRLVADELTMIQLRRVAAGRGLTLLELMRAVEGYAEIGPGTRRQVADFLRLVEEELAPFVHEPLRRINERLFRVLARRRSPYETADVETLRGLVAFLDVGALAEPLRRALDRKVPIQLVAANTLDGGCAAALLRWVLRHFFGRPVRIEPLDATPSPGPLRLVCGASEHGALCVTARDAGSLRYPATLMAWRLAAALLVACESAPQSDLAAFDLETTGLDPRYHSAVELAAQRLRGLRATDEGFAQLVNPGRSIPQAATDIHGIFPRDVRHAPPLHEALPAFLAYLGDAILLGHNVGFDLRFLRALTERVGLPPLQNPVVDTLSLARRLLPELPGYSLEALVEALGLPRGPFHRAMNDVQHTVHLFDRLWQEHRLDQQLHLLTDALPLVAVALAAEGNEAAENGRLVAAGCRVLQRATPTLPAWTDDLPAPVQATVTRHLRLLSRRRLPPGADDGAWQALRAEWERHIEQFLRLGGDNSLHGFLSYTALLHREPEAAGDEERLHLMTIHAAKGKEFRVVFLVGLEEGTLPTRRATAPDDLDEERRVCYVGMSRARERLYLLGCARRAGSDHAPSPFWHALDGLFGND